LDREAVEETGERGRKKKMITQEVIKSNLRWTLSLLTEVRTAV